MIKLPEQAAALRLIAERGADAFYHGPIGEAIARTIAADGGVMTADDLAKFSIRETPPLAFNAFGRRFITMPPPSSGGVAAAEILMAYSRTDALRAQLLQRAAARQNSRQSKQALAVAAREMAALMALDDSSVSAAEKNLWAPRRRRVSARRIDDALASSRRSNCFHALVECFKHAFAETAPVAGRRRLHARAGEATDVEGSRSRHRSSQQQCQDFRA